MRVNKKKYKTIWVEDSSKIKIIDQTLLPYEFRIIELKSLEDTLDAIVNMKVRGAPLIGVTAAFGIYLAAKYSSEDMNIQDAQSKLINTRPTAINLKWAVDKIVNIILNTPKKQREEKSLFIAQNLAFDDERTNEDIGKNGLKILESIYEKKNTTINILTHCNAGWLATVDWGTATAPIYKARDKGIPIHVWVDETRPRNQGSYLTSWELKNENIKHTIIVDNAGGHLMQNGLVDLVITGSDRTTYEGDVCNKIGTYLKALAANDNDIPFYVALPTSTIDWNISNFNMIDIEERDAGEVHYVKGINENGFLQNIRVTPKEVNAINYAFDITPKKYITGLITEHGIIKANKSDILKYKGKINEEYIF